MSAKIKSTYKLSQDGKSIDEKKLTVSQLERLHKTVTTIPNGSGPHPFTFYKGCLPQILLGPFLNTLSQMRADLSHFLGPTSY